MNPDKSKSVSASQVLAMTEEERSKLWSVCWHDSNYTEPRCECVGITDFKIETNKYSKDMYNISWSDIDGDPNIQVFDLDKPIHKEGNGEWDYGLYLPHDW